MQTFNKQNFTHYCNVVASKDKDLKQIVDTYGYPPFWNREASFETLLHFILEQQVSLASAKAALEKLRTLIGDITPPHLLSLSDEQFRACYFSRQKTLYARSLATAVTSQTLVIEELVHQSDERIRQELKQIKGIGDWTVDVFLLMSLHHMDVFPLGAEGLAPVIVQKLAEMVLALRKQGYTIVMVEQNFRFAAPLADRFMVMEHGEVIQEFTQAELPSRLETLHEYLGV